MAGATRAPIGAARATTRHPSGTRTSVARANSVAPTGQGSRMRIGATSPTNRCVSVPPPGARSPELAGTKRKERDYEIEALEETNINVVVRCRGRNEREVRENSGVVVSTEGARGKTVDLSMGPNALSNKTYNFDKVFSPAADQAMVYDDVVAPILDDMLRGYNCTVFAYGQTGTGKTYTMSGDMTESMGMLSDGAGIIPRVLCSLFRRLEADGSDSSIKCSFIELYNEELRDLLSKEDGTKLKMYEDTNKKGHTATVVQGVNESHIKSASEGIKLLQRGSHKRQVAATKCNDLSSRSHTVFTITVYMKSTAEDSEDYIAAGKLNLVDLAGSENIQRSGAENKRAAEAGLINKSLLTLGRVINALVDRSSHIPYRESKLTRLLQDSLGGHTKTCIIATLSPAKSNLEETISTLDYAFRAKNIRNKPQVNQLISKKTLLREFTSEIEKLKSELIATRQRNGVYLTNETYEEMTTESESRRILSEEQKAKIETMEANLRNKVQELFALTNDFAILKKDGESTRIHLGETGELLKQTEIVLADTRQNLADEALLRKAHQATEEELLEKGGELIGAIDQTVRDVHGLHAKLKRKSDVQAINRGHWQQTQTNVGDTIKTLESRLHDFETNQRDTIDSLSRCMQVFVSEQLELTSKRLATLEKSSSTFSETHETALDASAKGRDQMNCTLEEIKVLREEVKDQVGRGLDVLSGAAGRISKDVIEEMESLHGQLHTSYTALGKDFKGIFEELVKHLNSQREEAESLRVQVDVATNAAIESERQMNRRIEQCLEEERQAAAADRQTLLSQITDLIQGNGVAQEKRITAKFDQVREDMVDSRNRLEAVLGTYSEGMEAWSEREGAFQEKVFVSRDALKAKLKQDWTSVSEHNARIQQTTRTIHSETVRTVDRQMEDMGVQMQALDGFVTKARSQNDTCHEARVAALRQVATAAEATHAQSKGWMESDRRRLDALSSEVTGPQTSLETGLDSLDASIYMPLTALRNTVQASKLHEYQATGETPQKVEYSYPLSLPRTEPHDQLLGRNITADSITELPDLTEGPISPSKAAVFADTPASDDEQQIPPRPATADGSLRELPTNMNSAKLSSSMAVDVKSEADPLLSKSAMGPPLPPSKRPATTETVKAARGVRGLRADRENVPLSSAGGTRRLRNSTRNG